MSRAHDTSQHFIPVKEKAVDVGSANNRAERRDAPWRCHMPGLATDVAGMDDGRD